jgi:hypothetical protein
MTALTVRELVEKLVRDVPPGWNVEGTGAGSLYVWEPNGLRYGYVFTDDRATKLLTRRS